MLKVAKCPKCEKTPTHLVGEGIDIRIGGKKYLGVTYSCPWCRTILGSQMDPIAIMSDTVNQIKRR